MMFFRFLLTALLAGGILSGYAQVSFKGKVISRTKQEKLYGAVVTVTDAKGKTFNVLTDDDGEFKFKRLAAGEYDVKVEFVGYDSYSSHVTVGGNKVTEVRIELEDKPRELEDVRVFGKLSSEEEAGARDKEQRSHNIVNIISAQAMERSPDINAANVLQRMSGLTIQRNGGGDEAYPIIRGLDPRYNNTLINGVKITSPDDKSRFVPLNIVPSDLLGSIEVHKSLTPEMEGDAIGGTVNLVMKNAPEKETWKVLGSVGYSAIFFDRKYLSFSHKDIQQKSLIEKYGSGYTAQPGDFSRSNLDFKPVTSPPNTVGTVSYGRRFLKNKLGLMTAVSFQDQYYGSNSTFNQAAPDVHANGAPTLSDYANRAFSTNQLNSGLTVHLDYALNDRNKFTLTSMSLYSFLAQARVIVDTSILGGNGGRTVPGTGPVSTDYTSLTSRQFLENIMLQGKHVLSKHFFFDWTGVYSYAAKRTPDFADLAVNKKIDTVHTTNDIHGPYNFVVTPNYFDAITRTWQHNEDKDYDVLGSLAYRNKLPGNGSLELKAGGLYRHKVRYNKQDEYILKPTTSSSGIKQEFTDINTAQWTVYNSAGTYDYDINNYRVFEDVTAGYGQFMLFFPMVDITGGARVEKTKQGFTMNNFHPTGVNGVDKDYTDLLPSIDVKLKPSVRTNIRLSYYKAIARPNYYDLVPAPRNSTTDGTSTQGNAELRHSIADNYDIRYEWYPGGDEMLFGGVFYKKIQDPIEYILQSGTTYMPTNSPEATDYGAELAFTKYLGPVGFTGNYTYLYSKVYSIKSYYNLSTGASNPDTLEKRTLQGQTDHTLNLSLLYRSKKHKLFAELAFQYTGSTLAVVYPIYGYNYMQRPQSNLAFSAEKELKAHFTLFTKFNNLLNTHLKQEIGSLRVVDEQTKFNFSVGLRYTH
jgi:outer membrane receptor protein involved in Fe transport